MNEANGYKITMGKRIQRSRKAARLTQMEFSEKIDVSTQYISDLERGVVGCSVSTLIKICDALDVSADFILMGKEPETPEPPALSKEFSDLSPQKQALVTEGFELLKKAFSLKDPDDEKETPV